MQGKLPTFVGVRMTIDLLYSVWIVECQAVFYVRGLHTQAGKNPELRTLFFRLAHLLCYPITVIFVFDGPERPDYKRGTEVKKKEHWVVKDLSELIKGFRYKFHTVCAFHLSLTNHNIYFEYLGPGGSRSRTCRIRETWHN